MIFIKNLIIAIAYLLAAIAGSYVAVSPIGASPIWPAAGVALTGLHLYGKKLLPGLFIGILCAQIHSFQDFSSLDKIIDSLIIGVFISIGSTLQALFGLWLIRKNHIAPDDSLLTEAKILKFTFLVAFVSTIIAASVGSSTLLLNSIISLDQFALTWLTWWIGDSIGILLLTPIILIFLAQPRSLWRQRIKTVFLPLVIMLTMIYMLFLHSVNQEQSQQKVNFNIAVERFHAILTSNIASFEKDSLVLKAIFDSSQFISKKEFETFTRILAENRKGLFALEWIPKIEHQERYKYEQSMGGGFSILESTVDHKLIPAQTRQSYYPVTYIYPWEANKKAFGFDIASNPLAKINIAQAKASGQPAFSKPIQLVQDEPNSFSYVIYSPVFSKIDHSELKGIVASIFKVKDLIQNTLQPEHDLFYFQVKDADQIIYSNFPEKSPHGLSQFQTTTLLPIKIANIKLILEYKPSLAFINQHASWTIWLILLGGFLFAGLSGIGLLILSGRNMLTEDLVRQRTQEIKNAEQALLKQNTDLLKANEETKRAVAAKDQFFACMSHELRTPLNAVLGFSQIIQGDQNLTTEQKNNIREINNAGGHLLQLINNILDLAKIGAGKISMSSEEVTFSEIVSSCNWILKYQMQRKNIHFNYDAEQIKTIQLKGDALRIKQVLLNLLTNAVKYNSENGRITLSSQYLPSGKWLIEIADTGTGIAENQLDHLFTPFDRLDHENSTIEGTGIGLTISKTFIELMGGKIGVNSEYGEGSTFWFELKGQIIDTETLPEIANNDIRPVRPKTMHSFTILYVDDDEINRLIVERIFKKLKNINLHLAIDGNSCLEQIKMIQPDMILLDINMPGISGLELCPQLKEIEPDRPVIAVSADATDRAIKMAINAGFDDYLTKPLDIPALQNLVYRYIDKFNAPDNSDYSI